MTNTLVRGISAVLLVATLAACSSAPPAATPAAPSTNVNPITGSRGGGTAGR